MTVASAVEYQHDGYHHQHDGYHQNEYHQDGYQQQNVPQYQPAGVHYAPAPVVKAVAPVYHAAAPIVKAVAPVYHAAPVVKTVAPAYKHVEYDAPAKYEFSYSVHDEQTGDIKSQHEVRDGDNVQGSYSLVDADGHHRIVEYTADEHNGFNAVVRREPSGHKVLAPVAKVIAPVVAAPIAHYSHAPQPHYANAPVYHAEPVAHYSAAPVSKIFSPSIAKVAQFPHSAPSNYHY